MAAAKPWQCDKFEAGRAAARVCKAVLEDLLSYCYLEDITHLVLTCSTLGGDANIAYTMGSIRWDVEIVQDAMLNWWIENEPRSPLDLPAASVCRTCGVELADEWLGGMQCYGCYADH